MPSETKITKTAMEVLRDKSLYSPLEITLSPFQTKTVKNTRTAPDARIQVRWQDKKVLFIAVIKPRATPQIAQQAIWQLNQLANKNNNRLLVVPYLSKTITDMIEEERISAVDFNGNFFIQTKDILAIRLDRQNRYKESKPIKKIFSGNSSLVGRVLLGSKTNFTSVNQISQAISKRGGNIALSTISKVLKGLEEELIIQRAPKEIKLIQATKFLEKLKSEYLAPKIQGTLKLKVPDPLGFLRNDLPNKNWIFTGESSASRYTVTTPPKIFSAYVTEFKDWDQYKEERFYNLVLNRTEDQFVYFDAQKDNYASKLQCYLELSQLDKREKEIAQSIEKDILGAFQ